MIERWRLGYGVNEEISSERIYWFSHHQSLFGLDSMG